MKGVKVEKKELIHGKERIVYDYKNGLTLYDFRHASACYWITKYKSESALKYKFAWRTYKMIEYYTQFIE